MIEKPNLRPGLAESGEEDENDPFISPYISSENEELYQINEDSVEHFPTDSMGDTYKGYLDETWTQKMLRETINPELTANYKSESSDQNPLNTIKSLHGKKTGGYFRQE